ncbi:hypothetical protein Pyn_32175 [Prunus yedoensis var. nudiflora]|uniref:Uncharacterized protein n=1 Tax=Prunus yedoensis var. nudiflora TaxID=2094558 RepID=A0A315A6D7_PRUYE|nr:hypothetical protein Pyn_32175 [Prunus yedoensis var. nudiflora]
MNISNDGNHMLSGGAQEDDCSRDMLGGYANPGILDNREDDIENLQQVNDNLHRRSYDDGSHSREDGNENSLQVNDIASYALMMYCYATLLMTFTLNIKTYIPNKSKVQLFGLSMKTWI